MQRRHVKGNRAVLGPISLKTPRIMGFTIRLLKEIVKLFPSFKPIFAEALHYRDRRIIGSRRRIPNIAATVNRILTKGNKHFIRPGIAEIAGSVGMPVVMRGKTAIKGGLFFGFLLEIP